MNALAYLEDTPGWRPRHPVVCILDTIGFAIALAFLVAYRPSPAAAFLPLTIMLQFVVSFNYHWARFSPWRRLIDQSVIFMLIGATFVPYWGGFLPPDEAVVHLAGVAIGVVIGIGFLLAGTRQLFIGLLYAGSSAAGLVISFYELQRWLPFWPWLAFWAGAALYLAQQLVLALQRPDPFPELFGFREVQHVLILLATTTHMYVALTYT